MTEPEAERASLVCNTCKTRKKGCDKVLPTCGYCSKRSLPCWYNPLPEGLAATAVVDELTKSSWGPHALARYRDDPLSFEGFNVLTASSSPSTALSYDPSYASNDMAFGDPLCAYVSYFLGCLNLQVAELCHYFFDGLHQWLPIISPGRFVERSIQPPSGGVNAEDSILLLAMCLVVLRPSLDSPIKSPGGLKNLYLTVKSCFAKAQAVLTTTLPLVQAGILIAVYEYASRRAETAYISIEICATMASLLGLDQIQLQGDEDRPDPRLIIIEIMDQIRLPTTKFPANDFYLPTDLSYSKDHDAEAASGPQCTMPVDSFHSHNVSGFGRQAQAVSMLDQSLRILGSTEASAAKLRSSERLDENLRSFLTLVMREYVGPGRQCGANAIIIRTLFLLHKGVLDQLCDGAIANSTTQTKTWAAMDSAAKMMSDIAGHHGKHVANIDILPMCASYNAQIAAKHIAAHQDHTDNSVSAALDSLTNFDKAFRQRWPAHESLR